MLCFDSHLSPHSDQTIVPSEDTVLTKDPEMSVMLQSEEPLLGDEPVVARNDVLLDTEEQIAESLQDWDQCIHPVGDDETRMPNFSTQGWNCTLSKGASCSSQFAHEYLQSVCLNCMEMTRN